MGTPDIQSEAFRHAALRSERVRIISLIVALATLGVVVLLRALLSGDMAQIRLLPYSGLIIGGGMLYEAAMLRLVNLRIATERDVAPWVWIVNAAFEIMLPTAAILVFTETDFMGPYRALVAPAALAYMLFIILATLRLSPALCRVTGLFSAIGYGAMIAYTLIRYPDADAYGGAMPLGMYLTYCVFYLVGGFAAGAVAGQIRTHVAAALGEAEARRKAEQFEHDLNIARSIQQGLLPSEPPQVEGFDVAGWSQPADQTGGDYYDWQQLPDGRVAITLADVTGHGIGPALVTAVCRAYARASFPADEALATLTSRINELLVEDLPEDRFITFVVALLDPASASLQLLSAGHGPILLYRAADDAVEQFEADDIPFGISSGIDYGPANDMQLAPGDILVLVTDGFFEWCNAAGEQFGIERLNEAIRASSQQTAEQLIGRLHDAVLHFTAGTPQPDDLTAVVVKRVG